MVLAGSGCDSEARSQGTQSSKAHYSIHVFHQGDERRCAGRLSRRNKQRAHQNYQRTVRSIHINHLPAHLILQSSTSCCPSVRPFVSISPLPHHTPDGCDHLRIRRWIRYHNLTLHSCLWGMSISCSWAELPETRRARWEALAEKDQMRFEREKAAVAK